MIMADFTVLMILFKTSMTNNTITTNLKRNSAIIAFVVFSPVFFIQLPVSNHVSTFAWDKVFHCSYYLFFALWFMWTKTKVQKTFIVLFLFGVSIELLQNLTPHRSFELMDIVANTTGIMIGLAIFKLKSFLS